MVGLTLQTPPVAASVNVDGVPIHTVALPGTMGAAPAITVTVLVAEQVPSVYEIVVTPTPAPVTTPPDVTVAIPVDILLHVPPGVGSANV